MMKKQDINMYTLSFTSGLIISFFLYDYWWQLPLFALVLYLVLRFLNRKQKGDEQNE